jgi:hypothetical protein
VVERAGDAAWGDALRQSEGLVTGTGGMSFAARLERWLADARVEGAAGARTRERWLQTAAEADATFSGVLLDLAERGSDLALSTVGGRRHHGRIEVIGVDFFALRLATGSELLVAMRGVSAVRTAPLADPAVGERIHPTDLCLADVLVELAADRTRVLLVPADGAESVAGELRSVGLDVVTVRTDGEPAASAYVPLRSIAEVALG